MASKAELRQRIEDLETFHRLLGGLLEVSEFVPDHWGGERVAPAPGRQAEWLQAKGALDRQAPVAGRAFEEARMFILWRPPGAHSPEPLNPGPAWATICDDRQRFSLRALDDCTLQAMGALEDRIHHPIKGERGLRSASVHPLLRWVWQGVAFLASGLFLAWLAWKLGWS